MPENAKRVVIVEDEPGLVEKFKKMLGEYSISIESAKNAHNAIPMLLPETPNQRPDVVVLDIRMPYGENGTRHLLDKELHDSDEVDTGLNLLRHLREQEKLKKWNKTWVAVTTDRTDPDAIERLHLLVDGTGLVLNKPFDDIALEFDICDKLDLACQQPNWLHPT